MSHAEGLFTSNVCCNLLLRLRCSRDVIMCSVKCVFPAAEFCRVTKQIMQSTVVGWGRTPLSQRLCLHIEHLIVKGLRLLYVTIFFDISIKADLLSIRGTSLYSWLATTQLRRAGDGSHIMTTVRKESPIPLERNLQYRCLQLFPGSL